MSKDIGLKRITENSANFKDSYKFIDITDFIYLFLSNYLMQEIE